jgi:hypothetical protein
VSTTIAWPALARALAERVVLAEVPVRRRRSVGIGDHHRQEVRHRRRAERVLQIGRPKWRRDVVEHHPLACSRKPAPT